MEEGAPFRYEGAKDFFDKKSSWVDAGGDRSYVLKQFLPEEQSDIEQSLSEIVGNPLFKNLHFQVRFTSTEGVEYTKSSFEGGEADLELSYFLDVANQTVYTKIRANGTLFSASLPSGLTRRASALGISEAELRRESLEAMRLLKESQLSRGDGFLNTLRGLICGIAKEVQLGGHIGKSIWETGEVPRGLWLVTDSDYRGYYSTNHFTLDQISAGISDGVIGEVVGIPLMIKTVGEIAIDGDKRAAFAKLLSWDGLVQLWGAVTEDVADSWNDPDKREHFVSKSTVELASLVTGGALVSKGGQVAKASDKADGLIDEGLQRMFERIDFKLLVKDVPGDLQPSLASNLSRLLDHSGFEKVMERLPHFTGKTRVHFIQDLSDSREFLDAVIDNPDLMKLFQVHKRVDDLSPVE